MILSFQVSLCLHVNVAVFKHLCASCDKLTAHSYMQYSIGLHDNAITIHKTVTTSVWAIHHPDGIHAQSAQTLNSPHVPCAFSPHSPSAAMLPTKSSIAVGQWWDRMPKSSCRLTDPVVLSKLRCSLSRDG